MPDTESARHDRWQCFLSGEIVGLCIGFGIFLTLAVNPYLGLGQLGGAAILHATVRVAVLRGDE